MKLGPFWRRKYSLSLRLVKRLTGLFDYLLWIVLDPAKFKRIKNNTIKKILISLMHNGELNIGTDILILGIAKYFKTIYPSVQLVFVLDKKTKAIFGKNPGITFWEYNPKKKDKLLKKIKKENFDAVLLFDRDNYKIKDFINIPYRIYYTDTDPRLTLSLKNKFPITRKVYFYWGLHMVDFIFKMFETLGFKFEEKKFIFNCNRVETRKIQNLIKNKKIKKFIVLHPGSKDIMDALERGKWPGVLWPLERYANVADHFRKKGFEVLITGSKEESELAERINTLSKHGIINCCGQLTIREVGALLKKSSLLIAPDTSVIHIAYQVNCPILELFGPTDSTIAGAWPINKKQHKFLIDDGPCYLSNRKKECPEDIICLGRITTKDVIKEAEQLISLNGH